MITAKKLVARRGFEPRQTESKSVVLPLYYRAKQRPHRWRKRAKISFFRKDFIKNTSGNRVYFAVIRKKFLFPF